MTHHVAVTLSRTGRLSYPERTVVNAGDKLIWKFSSEDDNKIRWTVYFHHGSPFIKEPGYPHRFEAFEVARNVQLGPFSADEPGDYKYGLKAENAVSEAKLADDDPRLIVQRS